MKSKKPHKTNKPYKDTDKFLEIYKAHAGHIQKSCNVYGINNSTYYDWCKKYPEFKQATLDVKEELRGFWDDCALKEMAKGNSAILQLTHKSLKGTNKFPITNALNYDFGGIKTIEDIKTTRLRLLEDLGNGVVSMEGAKFATEMLDSVANDFLASDGFSKLMEMAEKVKKLKNE